MNRSLLISASEADHERIAPVLAQLDRMPTQVLLEATIAEVSLEDELKFGLRWFFETGNFRGIMTDAANGGIGSAFPGFSFLFSTADFKVVLNALSGVTDVRIVSSPSLMVLDNKQATLQVGDQVPVVTQTAQAVGDPDAPIVNSIEMRDTGVILLVRPHVTESGRVALEIQQEVSSVVPTTTSGIDSRRSDSGGSPPAWWSVTAKASFSAD
jgi:general secretion pathway protein D